MTRKERLKRCYFYEELDRPAVYSRAGFPGDDPTYDRLKAYLQEHTELKAGWCLEMDPGYSAQSATERHSEDFDRRVDILPTPRGPLQSTLLISRKGQPGLTETYFIKSRADAEKYLSLPWPKPVDDVAAFFAADAAIGERGIVEVSLGMNPGGFAADLCGSENFAVMSVTDRDILQALCERRMRIITEQLKLLLGRRVGPFFNIAGEEYIVPPLHGEKDFYDFNVKYDKPIFDLIHTAGGRVHMHCHGSLKRVFRGFLDAGVDVLHPFEPPPPGNITAAEAKAMARGRLCLEGNIQISRMYESSPEEIRRETEQLIRDTFDDRRGLIVSPTASPYIRGLGETCFPMYQAMIDTVLNWKG